MPHSHQGNQILNPLMSDGDETYQARILSYSPIAYWPLNETSGTAAICVVNALQNGTYARDVSVMGTQAGIGDGNTAPTFNGVVDEIAVYSATLDAAFDGTLGTAMCWFRVSAAGVWTDAADRAIVSFMENWTNYVICRKTIANNTVLFERAGSGVASSRTVNPFNSTAWAHAAITWSQVANRMRAFLNGVQQGADVAGLGVYVGALSANMCHIGEMNATGSNWSGGLAHCAVLGYEMAPAEILDCATV